MIAISDELYRKLKLLPINIPEKTTHHDFWVSEDEFSIIIGSLKTLQRDIQDLIYKLEEISG